MSLRVEIIESIRGGDHERVKVILEENPYLYNLDKTSEYPFLHICTIFNQVNMMQYLIDKGCLINSQDKFGRTPLMLAVLLGQTNVAKFLLSAGADRHKILNNFEQTVLHYAFTGQHMPSESLVELFTEIRKQFTSSEEMAERFISWGCHLYQAVYTKDVEVIEYLLDRGHSVHSMHMGNKLTALHFAVSCESVEMIKLLLLKGASAIALDSEGRTPLFYLYHHNLKHNPEKLRIINIFLDLNIFVKSCKTVNNILQIANILMRGNREAIRLVFQSYPNFDEKEEYSGKTMLHYLARNRSTGVLEELKLHIGKFNVNAVDEMGRNPLYWASKARNIDAVEYLLEQGASANSVRYVTNFPPLYYAYSDIKSDFRSARLIELLLQHNEDAQFIYTSKSNRKITIFDGETKGNGFYRMNLIIAHLAMLKHQGTPITKMTWLKIKAVPPFKRYFNKCRWVLQAEICGKVTIFQLLTSDDKKLASYLNQRELNLKLKRLSYKHQLKCTFPYYYNTLRKRLSQGRFYKMLKDNAAKILCKIFYGISEKHINKSDLIVNQIINYLNDQDLRRLLEV